MMKSDLSGKDRDRARQRALRKLSVRERTEKEILDFLREEGCTAKEAADITAEFREWGYLNDEKYCRRYFEYAMSKGKATARIIRELVQKGIPADKAEEVLETMRDEPGASRWADDRAKALSVGMKMAINQGDMGKAIDDKFLARVGRRLAGLGYDSGICYHVIGKVRDYCKEREREDE